MTQEFCQALKEQSTHLEINNNFMSVILLCFKNITKNNVANTKVKTKDSVEA